MPDYSVEKIVVFKGISRPCTLVHNPEGCCAEGEGEGEAGSSAPRSLEMENARLRAEVATQYAHEAARSMLAGDSSHLAASVQRSLQIGEPQVSQKQRTAAFCICCS